MELENANTEQVTDVSTGANEVSKSTQENVIESTTKGAEETPKNEENTVKTEETEQKTNSKEDGKKELDLNEKIEKLAKKSTLSVEKEEKVSKEDDGYKFEPKFKGIGQEYELPKWAQSAIKDAESEKEVKDIFSKAQGLDHVKMRHTELLNKHQEMSKGYDELTSGISELRNIYADATKSGNLLKLDDFFEILKIPRDVILNYALQKVQYDELPQDQRKVLDGQLEAERRAKEFESQNQTLLTNAQNSEVRARTLHLETSLARPEIQELVSAFESQPGRKPGDFKRRVIEQGEYTWYKTNGKTDLTPDEAIKQVVETFGVTKPAQQTQVAQQMQQTTEQVQKRASSHRDVGSIPTMSSRGTSAMKQKPRSIEDIRKMSREMHAG